MYDFVQFANQHDHVFRAPLKYLSETDARLIAAAPELYAVVEKLAKWNKDYPSTRVYGYGDIKQIAEEMEAINAKAIAALAKARGEIND